MMFAPEVQPVEPESWDVDQRPDGVVLVRVHSSNRNGQCLPDAVFAFRLGDPQYDYWAEQFRVRSAGRQDNSPEHLPDASTLLKKLFSVIGLNR